jgi:hypothetical protein
MSALYGVAAVVAVVADAPLAPLVVALLGIGLTAAILTRDPDARAIRRAFTSLSVATAAAAVVLAGVALAPGDPGAVRYSLPVGYAVTAVAFFVLFDGMARLSGALDLPWTHARWCTARWTALAPLICLLLTVDPGVLRQFISSSQAGPDRLIGSTVTVALLAIPLVQAVLGIAATSADLPQPPDVPAVDRARRPRSTNRLGPDEEAILLVLAGNSVWAVGALLGSVVLFDIGAATVIAGFGYNADLQRGLQGAVAGPARWMRAAWRQLGVLTALFVTCFVTSWEAPPGSPVALGLAVAVTIATVSVLDAQRLSRVPAAMGHVDSVERVRMHRASMVWGRVLTVIGWALLSGGVLVFGHALFSLLATASTVPTARPPELSTILQATDWDRLFRLQVQMLAGVVITSSGSQCRLIARRLCAIVATPDQQLDPFVLYLRPFSDDRRLAGLESWPRSRGAVFPQVWFHEILLCGRSEEEHLVDAIKRLSGSPVVAVGAPGEWRPPAGATRIYLDNPDWQPQVRELMARARLVVIALGRGEGTRWELVEAMRILAPQRLLLVIPMPAEDYETLRLDLHEALVERATELHRHTGEVWIPPTLPDFPASPIPMRTAIQAVVSYIDDWQPVVSSLGRQRYPTFYDTMRLPLRATLAPVFGRLRTVEGNGLPDNMARARIVSFAGDHLIWTAMAIQVLSLVSFIAHYVA